MKVHKSIFGTPLSRWRILTLASLLVLVAWPVYGQSYEVNAGISMAIVHKADNLWGDGHRAIRDIQSKPESMTRFRAFPVVELIFRPEQEKDKAPDSIRLSEIYLSTNKEPGSIAAGGRLSFGKSFVDAYGFYFFYASNWKNPYVLYRRPTTTYNYGGKVTYGNIAGTDFSVSYRFSTIDVDDDLIGQINRDLRQDGTTHTVALSYRFGIANTVSITPQISYEKGAYDGKSNSYDGYEGSLALSLKLDRAIVAVKASSGKNLFDKEHPYYGKTRDETICGGQLMVTFPEPFGWKKTAVTAGAAAGSGDANIAFFDRYSIGGFLSLSRRF